MVEKIELIEGEAEAEFCEELSDEALDRSEVLLCTCQRCVAG